MRVRTLPCGLRLTEVHELVARWAHPVPDELWGALAEQGLVARPTIAS
jgi:hypothetical protein